MKLSSRLRALKADFVRLAEVSEAAINAGNKLVFFGNGGSAGDAQHLATEFAVTRSNAKRCLRSRLPPTRRCLQRRQTISAMTRCLPARSRPFANRRRRHRDYYVGPEPKCYSCAGNRARYGRGARRTHRQGRGTPVGLADPMLIVPSNTTARSRKCISHWDRCCATFLNRGAPDMNASTPIRFRSDIRPGGLRWRRDA